MAYNQVQFAVISHQTLVLMAANKMKMTASKGLDVELLADALIGGRPLHTGTSL